MKENEEKVIEILEENAELGMNIGPNCEAVAGVDFNAVAKQIVDSLSEGKKVDKGTLFEVIVKHYSCPNENCSYCIIDKQKVCSDCGQKLDWSE